MSVMPSEVASLIIPLKGNNLLVPNSCVAEIVPYATTEKTDSSHEWVMGMMNWRDLPLPCLSFESLIGGEPIEESNTRIAIFNTLTENYQKRFYGLAITGIPRLVRVTEQELITDDDKECGAYEKMHVQLNGEACILPELEAIEKLLGTAGL